MSLGYLLTLSPNGVKGDTPCTSHGNSSIFEIKDHKEII